MTGIEPLPHRDMQPRSPIPPLPAPPRPRRLATVLHEDNVPFELFVIKSLTDKHKTPAFVTNQLSGQIPYIDDGFILYQSSVIRRYIEAKYPTGARSSSALIKQGLCIEGPNFYPNASKARSENIFTPSAVLFRACPSCSVLYKTRWARIFKQPTQFYDFIKQLDPIMSLVIQTDEPFILP
ncbi:hypothetical protein H0H81_006823 [Sphagnurus paluster]|uniref:glutathione transferase n=1 Tax=Sphagnurus paluster TaxID=117069 RepID=A0A9P7FTJ2_9AGAR|nr:hypothetical protein H0H81_006823 [Sphagnurus paluster]